MLEITDQLRRHAAWVDGQMRPVVLPPEMSTDDSTVRNGFLPLDDRLDDRLDDLGAGRSEVPTPIDLTAAPGVAGVTDAAHPAAATELEPTPIGGADRPRRAGRWVWAAMAAAALLAVLVASVAVVRSRPGQPDATDPTAEPSGLVATAPDSVLLPVSTPDGLVPIEVTTSEPTGRTQPGFQPTGPAVTQLFGVDQEAKLELRIEPVASGTSPTGGIDQVIRGEPGKRYPAGQPTIIATKDGSAMFYGQDTSNDRYSWSERGAFITASYRGLTDAEALQAIDAMQWTSPGLDDGFVPTGDLGLVSLLPATVEPSSGLGLEADVHYVVGPDATDALTLVTCPAGTGTCPGATYDYAMAWLNGTRAADGSITVSVDGATTPTGLVTDGFTLRVWPDGATAQVGFGRGHPADPDLAERVIADLAVTDRSGLDGLKAEIAAGLAAMPIVVAADLSGGRVEVHGVGHVSVTCVAPSGAPLTCGIPWVRDEGGLAPSTPINVSAIVSGHWVVGASSTNPGTIDAASGDTLDSTNHPAGAPLPAQTATVAVGDTTYELALIEVPDGLTGIMLTQSTPSSIGGGSVERPAH